MRRLAAWLCLFIALAGPLVSQAKIAYGIALSRAEVGLNVLESGQEIEDEDYDGRDLVTVVVAHPDAGLDGPLALPLPPGIFAFVPAPIASPRTHTPPGAAMADGNGRPRHPGNAAPSFRPS